MEVIGEVATAEQALEACDILRPDVALVDLGLPAGGGGLGPRTGATADGVVGLLLGHDPTLAVVGLCEPATKSGSPRRCGPGHAAAWISTPTAPNSPGPWWRPAGARRPVRSSAPAVVCGLRADDLGSALTEREREVRSLMERGLPDKVIAERLVLSVKRWRSTLALCCGRPARATAPSWPRWPDGRCPDEPGR